MWSFCYQQALKGYFFVARAVEKIISSQSVGKIVIIIISFSLSKNKNIVDNVGKETCAIMPTQITYEIDYISLLEDSTISNAIFCFIFMYFIVM